MALVTDPATERLSWNSAIAALAAAADLRHVSEVSALLGGGNNRVYRLVADGRSFLLKQYFHHDGDTRDRGATEFAFLRFAWDRGIRCIPQPIAWDSQTRLSLSQFVDGRKLRAEEVDARAVDRASEFYIELNSFKTTSSAQTLPDASEACFSLADHLECVDRRIQRLRHIPTPGKAEADAAAFVEEELSVTWSKVKTMVSIAVPIGELSVTLPRAARCLSPSDFGFHNALLTETGICFLDFEYAGWDDPAKTVCDFFCQPAVPVPLQFFESFAGSVNAHTAAVRQRIDLLFPVYQIKWCCIMLNHFAPVEAERKSFSGRAKLTETGKMAQLEKARICLSAVRI